MLSSVFAASDSTAFVIGVTDDASSKDTTIANDLLGELQKLPGHSFAGKVTTFSDIDYNDIYTQVTILIYKDNAIIIVALDGPVSDVIFASNAGILLTAQGITVETVLSDKVRSVNFLELFGIESIQVDSDCIDTDMGLNYYELGETYLESESPQEDSCTSDILIEFFCDSQGIVSEQTYDCPNGCSEGRCLEAGEIPNVVNETVVENESLAQIEEEVIETIPQNDSGVTITENRSRGTDEQVEVQSVQSEGFFASIIGFFVSLFT